jgi:hypothetical protein
MIYCTKSTHVTREGPVLTGAMGKATGPGTQGEASPAPPQLCANQRVKVNTKDKIKSLSSAKNTSPWDEAQRAPASTAATVAMETRLQTVRREGQRDREGAGEGQTGN